MVDLVQPSEVEGCGAQGVQQPQGLIQGFDFGSAIEYAADDDAQHGDLIPQALGRDGSQVTELSPAELARVEAVLEGVDVAPGCTGTAFGSSVRSVRHV